ncbi:FAD/NAD(P)-binding protein [Rubrivivax gelatinosus]|uniref:FAD/NAD(P)-binding protein n=1 Tax=Rubrivivax gelatinosus TaxID=28068 RepID=UPI001904FABA|nr:FAD/NAD(P)-binding protein [Rubrivivax gelatinosus]
MSIFPSVISGAAPLRIAVVGAGFSGAAVVVHLLRLLPAGSCVHLLERGGRFGRGLAYGTCSPSHWLNVPAGGLALDPARPDAFVQWLQQRFPAFGAGDFVPRMLLGEYFADELAAAEAEARVRGVELRRHVAEVRAIEHDGRVFHVTATGLPPLAAERVVLATGHLPPRRVALPGADWDEPGFVADPYAPGWQAALPDGAAVLVLGTGLSAIDVLMALQDRGHAGPVTLLSRRGLLPQAHRWLDAKPQPASVPQPDWQHETRLRPLLRTLRRTIADAAAQGCDWRDVMARMRPQTPALWQRLSARDRRQFLRHLQPWWDSHRHRLAPGIHARLTALAAAGRVELTAGRLQQLQRGADGRIGVRWQRRGGGMRQAAFDAVVNCTGASAALAGSADPLLASLCARGWLQADPLGLGLLVDDGFGVPGVPGLYYIGPMLKAQRWEAIAVPELRQHAKALAQVLAAGALAPA